MSQFNRFGARAGFLHLAVFAVLSALMAPAHADDWGCQVLLCLSNPNGPEAVSECVPPIERLWEALRKNPPDPFPTCDTATDPRTGQRSWAQQGFNWYDACPAGTTALASGEYAAVATGGQHQAFMLGGRFGMAQNYVAYAGIGDGNGLPAISGEKVCVGRATGTTSAQYTDPNDPSNTQYIGANTYDRVVLLDPQRSPRIIDVYVAEQLWRRVRW